MGVQVYDTENPSGQYTADGVLLVSREALYSMLNSSRRTGSRDHLVTWKASYLDDIVNSDTALARDMLNCAAK